MATIGNTLHDTDFAFQANYAYAIKIQFPAGYNIVSSISFYTDQNGSLGQDWKGAIWDSNGDVIGVTPSDDTWDEPWTELVFTTPIPVNGGVDYYIGFVSDVNTFAAFTYDTGNIYNGYYDASNNYDTPQSIGSSPTAGQKYAFIATYTSAIGPTLNYVKGPSLLSDEFNDSSLDVKWTEDYQAGGDSTEAGTALFITSGADEHPNFSGVYQDITGDFDFRMKLTDTNPDNIGSNAEVGLAFWIDDTHYFVLYRNSTTNFAYTSVPGGNGSGSPGWDDATDQYFRVMRSGSNVSVYTSNNNSSWTQRGTTQSTGSGAGRIYILANDDVAGGDFIAEVDWFRAEPNITDPVSMQLYATDSTAWDDVIVTRVVGVNWYGRLDSNLGHTYGTDLRVRQNGTTYTVLTEDND